MIKRAEKQYKNAADNAARYKQSLSQQDKEQNFWDFSSSASKSESTALTRRSPGNPPPWSMKQTVYDVAIMHFMTSYVPCSHFEYLPQLYGQLGATTVLPATVDAVAIASLGRDLQQQEIMKIARQRYTRALNETNTALANSRTAQDDATLVSVLLLSLFEAIVWDTNQIPDNWELHSKGAFELLKLRGPAQFKTDIGRKLFTQVANITCINHMQSQTRIPQELEDLVATATGPAYESETPRYRLATLSREMSNLVADIHEGKLSLVDSIEAATLLDHKYIHLSANFPPEWEFLETRLARRMPGVHGWVYHQYPNTRVVKLWNSMRMSRILLNEGRMRHAQKLPSSSYSLAVEFDAAATIQRMCTDIAASIPQFTKPPGLDILSSPPGPTPEAWKKVSNDTAPSLKATAAALMWPLSVIRSTSVCSMDLRLFAKEQLKSLGQAFHLPQAEKVATEGRDEDQNSLHNGLHMFYVS